jgi:hypothetical protein
VASFGFGSELAVSGESASSFKSSFLITLIGGDESRACLEASAAAATADGLIDFGFAGCGLAACEVDGCASLDCGALGCWVALPTAKSGISTHPSIPKRIAEHHIAG